MPERRITVNGSSHSVDLDEDTPLLWVLRDALRMPGTKYGCGQGLCGACTVLLDGDAVRSCVTPLGAVGRRRVTTIEIRNHEIVDALRAAWQAEDVPQCGYCQPGQIMAATALLQRDASPGDRQVDDALRGNVCRCGTYIRIRRAVKRASVAVRGPAE